MKKFEILLKPLKCNTDMKWTNALGKTYRLAQCSVATNIQFAKKKKKSSIWEAQLSGAL